MVLKNIPMVLDEPRDAFFFLAKSLLGVDVINRIYGDGVCKDRETEYDPRRKIRVRVVPTDHTQRDLPHRT